jgi:hypothetical protein
MMDGMSETPLDAYHRAQKQFPEISPAEGRFRLPDCLLFAVGYRETLLTNEVGDGGHGHGIFQLDDRSHQIPTGFDQSVPLQVAVAGQMLFVLLSEFAWSNLYAVAAYNAGVSAVRSAIHRGDDVNSVTTGGNYARDVLAHLSLFHADHIAQHQRGR